MPKISLTPIPLKDLKPLIKMAFQDDPQLLTKYSLLKTSDHTPTLEESVDKNYETILEAVNNQVFKNDLNFYAINITDKDYSRPIGFTVTVTNEEPPHMLFSFGINILYRNKKNSTKWLQAVKELLGKYLCVPLHKNNQRAIEFFEKNGFSKKANEVDTDCVILISNFKDLVHLKSKTQELEA